MKKKILWFSRHEMTAEQREDLTRVYGKIEVKQVSMSAASYADVVEAGKDCDVLAVVLPPAILGDLVNPRNNQKPVIRAMAKRELISQENGEEKAVFHHLYWERVLRMEIVTEKL